MNLQVQERKAMQNVSSFEAANNIRQCEEAIGNQDMLCLLLGVNDNLVVAEARYCKTCYECYVQSKSTFNK